LRAPIALLIAHYEMLGLAGNIKYDKSVQHPTVSAESAILWSISVKQIFQIVSCYILCSVFALSLRLLRYLPYDLLCDSRGI